MPVHASLPASRMCQRRACWLVCEFINRWLTYSYLVAKHGFQLRIRINYSFRAYEGVFWFHKLPFGIHSFYTIAINLYENAVYSTNHHILIFMNFIHTHSVNTLYGALTQQQW